MKTFQTIIAALAALAAGWQKNDSLNNDIVDANLVLGELHTLGVGGAAINVAQKIVGATEAGAANLAAGQAAVVGSEFGYTLVLVKNGGAAAQSLGV